MREKTPRLELRAWLREKMIGQIEVRLSDLADEALATFSKDPEFCSQLLSPHLRVLLMEEARTVAGNTRDGLLILGDLAVTRERIKQRAATLERKWSEWLEHAGDRHVRLLEMDATDLLKAAHEREKAARINVVYAQLWRSLAMDLSPGQRVRDRFSAQDVEERLVNIQMAFDAQDDSAGAAVS